MRSRALKSPHLGPRVIIKYVRIESCNARAVPREGASGFKISRATINRTFPRVNAGDRRGGSSNRRAVNLDRCTRDREGEETSPRSRYKFAFALRNPPREPTPRLSALHGPGDHVIGARGTTSAKRRLIRGITRRLGDLRNVQAAAGRARLLSRSSQVAFRNARFYGVYTLRFTRRVARARTRHRRPYVHVTRALVGTDKRGITARTHAPPTLRFPLSSCRVDAPGPGTPGAFPRLLFFPRSVPAREPCARVRASASYVRDVRVCSRGCAPLFIVVFIHACDAVLLARQKRCRLSFSPLARVATSGRRMEKENTLCPTNVLESASVPGLMMLLATLIAGGIVLVIFYAVSRRSRTRQDSQKPTYYDVSQFVPANSTTPMYIPPPVTMQQPRESGKRARNKKRREVPQEREHRWTIGVMKGHTGLVNDMDFSSNGRFVASCADDENLRETRKHVQSAGQYMYKKKESKKKASSSLQTNVCDHTESQSSARREDKEAGRASRSRSRGSSRFSSEHGTVPEEPTSHEVFTSDTSSNDDIPDESQWQMMFLSGVPAYLASTINRYILSPGQLFEHGCPVESTSSPGYAIINNIVYPSGPKIEAHDSGTYSNSSSSDNSEQESSSDNEKNLDNENRPDKEKSLEKRNSSGNGTGRDSESSSDNEKSSDDQRSFGDEKSCDSESSSNNEKSPGNRNSSENEKSCDSGSSSGCENSPGSKKSSEHKRNCNRKSSSNNKNSTGDETCLDKRRRDKRRNCDSESSSDSEKSPGKKESGVGSNTGSLKRTCERCKKTIYVDQSGEYLGAERCIYHHGKLYNRMTNDSWYYTCCSQAGSSRGCAECKTHVWSGLVPGYNGPLADYVRTMPSIVFRHDNNYGIYAMDCEMCYTRRGLELARVSLVDLNGQIVYDEFVKPSSEVIDHNTRFSGITEEILLKATKTLPEVQNDLLGFICAETILMGHGLGNDLRALRMIHTNVLDTCVIHPHYLGIPYRNGLRTLARKHLNRNIQEETHDSIEDARVVVDLVWKKAQDELRS